MGITADEFKTALTNKLNALVAANDRREKPWTRKEFIRYIQGAIDWYLFSSGNPDSVTAEALMIDIYIDSDILDEIPLTSL